jgi:hypothetical protein
MNTPVAYIVFNRPESTQRVFAEIRRARPETLFIIADGPRDGVPADAEKCAAVRAIVENVDWPCTVHRLYSKVNLGCKVRPASGIDAVFQEVEECIILEDDCLPDPSFFPYCAELLARYRDDTRIMCVGGSNFQEGQTRGEASYYYSLFAHSWGWATWRRAWKKFDVDMPLWPAFRDSGMLGRLFGNANDVRFWTREFDAVHSGRLNTWDWQWMFACWSQSGLVCLPNVNLIENLGFGEDATHTEGDTLAVPRRTLTFPLRHPDYVMRDEEDVIQTMRYRYEVNPHGRLRRELDRFLRKSRRLLKRLCRSSAGSSPRAANEAFSRGLQGSPR